MTQIQAPDCIKCKHFYKGVKWRCAAFPDGIPKEIIYREKLHRKPIPGDNGIQFEPRRTDGTR